MPAVLVGLGVLALVGWLLDHRRPAIEGETDLDPANSDIYDGDGDPHRLSPTARPEPARDWPYPILWAPVPFVEDSTASKIRPVVMLDSDDNGLTALALFSKSHTSNTTYSMQIDPDSAASFDRRARCSYIEVTRVIHIPWDQIPDNLGRVGALSHADQRRLEAALREWEVHV